MAPGSEITIPAAAGIIGHDVLGLASNVIMHQGDKALVLPVQGVEVVEEIQSGGIGLGGSFVRPRQGGARQ